MPIQCTPSVEILADSISAAGKRIVTFQLEYWRAIHAEVMTHRVFSRNAGSSRARPTAAIIKQVRESPWGPEHWGKNQSGMQASEELTGYALVTAQEQWLHAADTAASQANAMHFMGAHKQIVNRLLEPFSSINVVLTSTEWDNFFELRCHKDAQPEIQTLAAMMRVAMQRSRPRRLLPGEWHLPYIRAQDWLDPSMVDMSGQESLRIMQKASAARCARVSYKPFDATQSSLAKDLELFDKLAGAKPFHASPLEHQATPITNSKTESGLGGNLSGWIQFRHLHLSRPE